MNQQLHNNGKPAWRAAGGERGGSSGKPFTRACHTNVCANTRPIETDPPPEASMSTYRHAFAASDSYFPDRNPPVPSTEDHYGRYPRATNGPQAVSKSVVGSGQGGPSVMTRKRGASEMLWTDNTIGAGSMWGVTPATQSPAYRNATPMAASFTQANAEAHAQSPPTTPAPTTPASGTNNQTDSSFMASWWEVGANQAQSAGARQPTVNSHSPFSENPATAAPFVQPTNVEGAQSLNMSNVNTCLIDPATGDRIESKQQSDDSDFLLPGIAAENQRATTAANSLPDLVVPSSRLPPLRPPRRDRPGSYIPSVEEDDRCEVCWENHTSEADPIIECTGCGVLVHQQCYGVSRADGVREWYCCVCQYWRGIGYTPWNARSGRDQGCMEGRHPAPLLYCVICLRPRGAMKVGKEGKWAHVNCILYNTHEGPQFRNVANRTNPVNIDKSLVAHSRSRFCCSICRGAEGFTRNCSFPGCTKRVHVACVFTKGQKPKLEAISTEVPIFHSPLFPWRGATSTDPGETRVVEKLITIVTCEDHSSEDAHRAVKSWEEKSLKNMERPDGDLGMFAPPDMSSALRGPLGPPPTGADGTPTSAGPADLATGMGGGGYTPGGTNPGAPGAAGLPSVQPWMAKQHPPHPYGQYAATPGPPYAAAYRPQGYYVPPHWGMPPFGGGGYPQMYRPRAFGHMGYPPMYPPAPGMDRTAASAYQHYGGWPGQFPSVSPAPHMFKVHQPPNPYRPGQVKVRVGVTNPKFAPSGVKGEIPTTAAGPDAGIGVGIGGVSPTSPASKKGKVRAKKNESGASTTAAAKAKQKAAPKAGEIGAAAASSAKLAQNKRKRGTQGGTTTITTGIESVARSRPASRRRVEGDDDFGDDGGATYSLRGAATRGLKMVWSKCDDHFKSLRGSCQRDPLVSFLISLEADVQSVGTASKWSWILSKDSEGGTTPTSAALQSQQKRSHREDRLLDQIREVWMKDCQDPSGNGSRQIGAPWSVVLRTEASNDERYTWSLWAIDLDSTSLRNIAHRQGSLTNLMTTGNNGTIDISSMSKISVGDKHLSVNDMREAAMGDGNNLRLLKAFRISEYCSEKVKTSTITLEDYQRILHTEAANAAIQELSNGVGTQSNFTSADLANKEPFDILIAAALKGHENPTATLAPTRATAGPSANYLMMTPTSSVGLGGAGSPMAVKRTNIEQSCWSDIRRLEALLTRRYNVPPFFILVKKLPPELTGRQAVATQQAAAVAKYMESREGVALTLDPNALKKTAAPSKKMYLHNSIWELNPPLPSSEVYLRQFLPSNSKTVGDLLVQIQRFLHQPNGPYDSGFASGGGGYPFENDTHILIPDETTKDLIQASQKARLAASKGEMLSSEDHARAKQGDEVTKYINNEKYWNTLFFADDFVRRQSVFHFLLWLKRRSRLRNLTTRILNVLRSEIRKEKSIIEQPSSIEKLKKLGDEVTRWSALRQSVHAGHQDPSQQLVDKIIANEAAQVVAGSGMPAAAPNNSAVAATSESAANTNTNGKIQFCLVCFGAELDNLNPLVHCQWCGTAVHKNCYAVGQAAQLDLDIVEWYCERCEQERKLSGNQNNATKEGFVPGSAKCAICLRPGGALKRLGGTAKGSPAFVHVTCALWIFPKIKCHTLSRLTEWNFHDKDNSGCGVCQLCSQQALTAVLRGEATVSPTGLVNAGGNGTNLTGSATATVLSGGGGTNKRAALRRNKKLLMRVADEDEDMTPSSQQQSCNQGDMDQIIGGEQNAVMSLIHQCQSENPVSLSQSLQDVLKLMTCTDGTMDPSMPLGPKGFTVVCAHEGCARYFHPLCAWLSGLRVEVHDNYFSSVSDDTFAPSLSIKFYCDIHTPEFPPRLPRDVISRHRARCYISNDVLIDPMSLDLSSEFDIQTFSVAAEFEAAAASQPPAKQRRLSSSTAAAAATASAPSGVKTVGETGPNSEGLKLPPIGIEVHHGFGDQMAETITAQHGEGALTVHQDINVADMESTEYVSEKTLPKPDESVMQIGADGLGVPPAPPPSGLGCDVRLAGADQYDPAVCMVCLESSSAFASASAPPGSNSWKTMIRCGGCSGVWCHRGCAVGVMSSTVEEGGSEERTLCNRCTGTVPYQCCALCPRLGGAFVQVAGINLVSVFVNKSSEMKEEMSKRVFSVHKFCLLQHLDGVASGGQLMSGVISIADDVLSQYPQSTTSALPPLIPPRGHQFSDDIGCDICTVKDGSLWCCGPPECMNKAHPLCAAITGRWRYAQTPEPSTKRRRTNQGGSIGVGSQDVSANYFCPDHSGGNGLNLRSLLIPASEVERVEQLREAVDESIENEKEMIGAAMETAKRTHTVDTAVRHYIENSTTNGTQCLLSSTSATAGSTLTTATSTSETMFPPAALQSPFAQGIPLEPLSSQLVEANEGEEGELQEEEEEVEGVPAELVEAAPLRVEAQPSAGQPVVAPPHLSLPVGISTRSRRSSTATSHSRSSPGRRPSQTPTGKALACSDSKGRNNIPVEEATTADNTTSSRATAKAAKGSSSTTSRMSNTTRSAALKKSTISTKATSTAAPTPVGPPSSVGRGNAPQSRSDLGRRKRKRRLVQEESDSEEEVKEAKTPTPTPTPTILPAPTIPKKRSSTLSNNSGPLTKAPKKQKASLPVPATTKRASEPASSTAVAKRKATLPMRNEKGQFVKRAAASNRKSTQ